MSEPEVWNQAIEPPTGQLPPPEDGPAIEVSRRAGQKPEALIWHSGTYSLAGGRAVRTDVRPPQEVSGPWQVEFQPGRGAPPEITVPELLPLERHPDSGARYFSGTATYKRSFTLSETPGEDRPVYLDLGRVEVLAEVRVNGKAVGAVWKEPYRLDITGAAHGGVNTLEVRVTNLWPNRMIGDEQLPAENDYRQRSIVQLPDWYLNGEPKPAVGRITFSTWQFFTKEEPLTASGLLGPVRILFPARQALE